MSHKVKKEEEKIKMSCYFTLVVPEICLSFGNSECHGIKYTPASQQLQTCIAVLT